ncbi:MAG: ribosome maturation factor RimM [Thermoflexales bacterium]
MASRDLVSVGIIHGAHGVRGEVKLASFTQVPDTIARYGPLRTGTGSTVEIVKLRPRTNGFIAILKGVVDRDQAEALKGTELFVARSLLPEPAGDEVYLGDLVGLAVWLKDGRHLGEVVNIADYGAGTLLDVKLAERPETMLIPFARSFITDTNVKDGKITVELPEGYLDGDERPQ